MYAKRSLLLVVFILCCASVACDLPSLNPGANRPSADQGSRATPRVAPTFPPTYTPTPTLLPTNTPDPSAVNQPTSDITMTPTPTPPPDGWLAHGTVGFHIILPERWNVVDEQFAGDTLKFEAVDSETAGGYDANVVVFFQYQYGVFTIEEVCTEVMASFESMGVDVIKSECDMTINGLPAGRLTIRLAVGSVTVKEYLYYYAEGTRIWLVELGVDETAWTRYEAIFTAIGESFVLD